MHVLKLRWCPYKQNLTQNSLGLGAHCEPIRRWWETRWTSAVRPVESSGTVLPLPLFTRILLLLSAMIVIIKFEFPSIAESNCQSTRQHRLSAVYLQKQHCARRLVRAMNAVN